MSLQLISQPYRLNKTINLLRSLVAIMLGLHYIGFATKTSAQIVPDTSLPTNSVVEIENGVFWIRGGSRSQTYLFHSFNEFSVPTGTVSLFDNPVGVQTIFARVTGSSQSIIDGIVGANDTASVFLLNPNGIIFGENASFEIGGSFVGSTADRVVFADGTLFGTDTRNNSLLTISIPIGLQFGGDPGAIVNRSRANPDPVRGGVPRGLEVSPGQNLVLIGGEIRLDRGYIFAPGSTVEIASFAANSYVEFGNYHGSQYQDIYAESSWIDVSNFGVSLPTGNITLTGRNIHLTDGSVFSSIGINGDFVSNGDITLHASEKLTLSGFGFIGDLPSQTAISTSTSSGDAGNISIKASSVQILEGASLTSVVVPFFDENQQPLTNSGNGGSITINATNYLEVSGYNSIFGVSNINVTTLDRGSAGHIAIESPNLRVVNGGQITAESDAFPSQIEQATGEGGSIFISSENVEVAGSGIEFDGTNIASQIDVSSESLGPAGSLEIKGDRLIISDGAEITASSGFGDAGNISIQNENIYLDRGTILAETTSGQGNIFLNSNNIQLRDRSQITANATGEAMGGNIAIATDTLTLLDESSITANAIIGQGGNIRIDAAGIFQEDASEIQASSQLGRDGEVNFNLDRAALPDTQRQNDIEPLPSLPENFCDRIPFQQQQLRLIEADSVVVSDGKTRLFSRNSSTIDPRDPRQRTYRSALKSAIATAIDRKDLQQATLYIEQLQLLDLQPFYADPCWRDRQVSPNTAIVYTTFLDGKLVVIYEQDGMFALHTENVAIGEVEANVVALRSSLTSPDIESINQQLQWFHNLLLEPFQDNLNDVDRVTFVLDGALRNLPIAALYDGDRYLIEKYSFTVTPSTRLFMGESVDRPDILAVGLSESRHGYPALPGVEKELGEVDASVLMNEQFTRSELREHLDRETGILHVASHAEFSDPENSFILAWDGKISMAEFGEIIGDRPGQPLDLLVLSACQTATGDNNSAVWGIAGLALRSGASSLIATLTLTRDDVTQMVMTEFYRQLQDGIDRPEALRQALLTVLESRYYHPARWGVFTLIGN